MKHEVLNQKLSQVGERGKDTEVGEIKITYKQLRLLDTLLKHILENYQILEENEFKKINKEIENEIMAIM